ncbi:glycoside hydrolase family 3 C-terminal domain-containing protein [Neobacillus cucumis]|uniref:glycoside hydrolase family 3 N-terminal domain-containing protein n=1 Tax=Neobacillus cucumis TaxID=1740721 RepID=UPI0018DFEEE1|nr:glycoside hydrolase family 3 N-terminal domain-containing protein [Neobacillus cucumis]MBI0579841.1 glycoside hydrolase family 3 C-terminal domain-containing protein [Neobacillus cucumis]
MVEQQLTSLLEQMTLDEKIAQLLQLAGPFYKGSKDNGEITGPMAEMGITLDEIENSGSVLGVSGAEDVIRIQEEYLKTNRLGIPLLFMADVVHGYQTIFPVPLAIGCSWDLELAEKSAEIAAKEAAVSGVHVTFAPMVDLVRDSRWGRVMESTGEDPYLNSEFARAFVRGFQGENLKEDTFKVAACVKHFAAYGAPEGGRDYNTVNMSERQLRESYLPAYKAALDEGCEMVMTSFNTVDGIPSSGNKWLMRDLLRGEWKFDGVVISDWGAVKELIPHGVAEDEREAAAKSILAGVDIEMMTACYVKNLKQLVETNEVDEAMIDEAVLRILQLKQKLGLFENPYRGANEKLEREVIMSKEHRQISRELATKSVVLLKNDHVLPLKKEQKIALIGPFGVSGDILGPWSWRGSKDEAVPLSEGLLQKTSDLTIEKGCEIETVTEEQLEAAVKSAQDADIIVLALGEDSEMSGEAGCRADIRLPESQLVLVSRLKQLGKPMVAVLFNGRPLDLHGVIDQTDAVLEAWYPGTEGGAAVADILFGDVNPSGKLTMSFPYSVGQVPVYYNCFNTGRPKLNPEVKERYLSQYLDIPNEPLLPFGFGLSYTSFRYHDFILSSDILTSDSSLTLSVMVTNTGEVAGDEVVQLYIRDLSGEVVRPIKELKAYEKVTLQPGESKEVTFTITEEQLRYYHSDLTFASDQGSFEAYIGPDSQNVTSFSFKLLK